MKLNEKSRIKERVIMAKKHLFKTDFGGTAHTTDPEALFRDLRGRSPDIKHLWSHQADLLRAYHRSFRAAKDVAIELPTGAGKTLVGLLIAEFRRRALSGLTHGYMDLFCLLLCFSLLVCYSWV